MRQLNRYVTLGHEVRATRLGKSIGLRELARRLGITAPYLVDIEADRRMPSEPVVRRLANELELDATDLMDRAGRLGEETDRYLARRPTARLLLRRLAAVDLGESELRRLINYVDGTQEPEEG